MKTRACLAVFAAGYVSCIPAAAQEVTGALGSPSATSTIDGQSLPAAPPAFGGTINLDAEELDSPGGRLPWCRRRARRTCF